MTQYTKYPIRPSQLGGGAYTRYPVISSEWTPRQSNAKYWFRGDGVMGSIWVDRSRNSYNASLISTGDDPVVVPDAINEQPSVSFNEGKYFQFAAGITVASENDPFTTTIVFKAPVPAGSFGGLLTIQSAANRQQFLYIQDFDVARAELHLGGGMGNPGGMGVGVDTLDYSSDFVAVTISYNGSGSFNDPANYTCRINNVDTEIVASGGDNSTNGGNYIGALDGTGVGKVIGEIAEVFGIPQEADEELYNNINTYLYNRYLLGTVPTEE